MDTPNKRLIWARTTLSRHQSAVDAARAMGVNPVTYAAHENGTRGIRPNAAAAYAEFYGISPEWLLFGTGEARSSGASRAAAEAPPPTVQPAPNASEPMPARFSPHDPVPVFGRAAAGIDGRFVMNGERVSDLFRPPTLVGVKDAYAVYVHGDSMVPRYFAGEAVWVNPHIPVRRDDFVVAQIAADLEGEPPFGFVKQFVSLGGRDLVLRQLNPPEGQDELMYFDRSQVVSIHKIVLSGQG